MYEEDKDEYECVDCGTQFTEDEIQDNMCMLLCEYCGGDLENLGH